MPEQGFAQDVNSAVIDTVTESAAGAAVAGNGVFRYFNDTGRDVTVLNVRLSCSAAPAGAYLLVDVVKNGVSVFSVAANRPKVTAGSATLEALAVPVQGVLAVVAPGQWLRIYKVTVGTTPAQNVSVQVNTA